MLILDVVCFNLFILLIWFHTNLPLKICQAGGFFLKHDLFDGHTFPNWLNIQYQNLITKVLSCEFCLAFWLSLVTSVLASVSNFLTVFVFTLGFYYGIRKLAKD